MIEKLRPYRAFILIGVFVGSLIIFMIILLDAKTVHSPANLASSPVASPENVTPPAPEQPSLFPSKTKSLLPDNRLVALYGAPDIPVLGSLGEQPVDAAINRVKALAVEYQKYSNEPIYPSLEIIATVASASPTTNGDYSSEADLAKLTPWVSKAKEAGVYVILDLQPGHTDFLTQAKLYEPLLSEPHVGLALDPEWRLKPGQKHMKQVGSVTAAEVNQTAAWLADLTKSKELPQKLFLLHQFKLSMIENRETLDTSRPELAWLIQMDGLGAQGVKQDTWRNIRNSAPAGINFGWKNFFDEDKPMLLPEQTMQVTPTPSYISYQ